MDFPIIINWMSPLSILGASDVFFFKNFIQLNFSMKIKFLVVLLMVYTFRNLLGLLESAIMLQTSTLEINL